MSAEVFKACVRGYTDRIFDLQILGVQQGYWAGYYTRTRKPKPLKSIIDKLFKSKTKNKGSIDVSKPEIDVETFQKLEARFQERWRAASK